VDQSFERYVDQHFDEFVQQLRDYCKHPCMTGQGIGVRETAEATAEVLRGLGANTQILKTGGAPVVFGEIGSGDRTLLFYNHYDVQPPEPLDLWESGPFDAEVRDGKVYARGVSDNRGDVMARVQAVQSYLATKGKLPVKVKFIVEGEEEIGSPSLQAFVRANRDLLACDGCIWEGAGRDQQDRSVLCLGLKGVVHLELRLKEAKVDLHSSLATIVPNAAWRMVWALSTLKSPDDKITVDGLMNRVFVPTEQQLDLLRAIPFEEEQLRKDLEIEAFNQNLTGLALLRKHLYEPTCTIQGLVSGYSGIGLKAVSPCEAIAKIEFRLVPNLEPDVVIRLLREHLDRRGFEEIEIITHAALGNAQASPEEKIAVAAVEASEEVDRKQPVVYPWMAGSGPMSFFRVDLDVPVVGAGSLWWHDARAHAPNESIRIADYRRGISLIGALIDRFAAA
jgi:acetylornithine deacetylase/succinyl-diaminopimelate desuccinylase-like protein